MLRQFARMPPPPRDRDSLVSLLVHTLPGRAILAGAAIRLLAWLVQQIVGEQPIVAGIGVLGTLILLAGVAVFTWRLIARARRLLWQIRLKLALSFIFVGLIPALLITVFFLLCGVLLLYSVSAYVVQSRVEALTVQVQDAAVLTAADLSVARAPEEGAARLARRQEALSARFGSPGVSLAVVPIERACASDRPAAVGLAVATPIGVGPWGHTDLPETLPAWVPCRGFAGLVTDTGREPPNAVESPTLVARAVALGDGPQPRFAVIVDLPIDRDAAGQIYQQTGIALGGLAGGGPAGVQHTRWWVVLDHTDWATGRYASARLSIDIGLAAVYERVLPRARAGAEASISETLVVGTVAVGSLFLIIQFVALVMGLAIARSITGSVHELFTGTERVRQGDFSHQIRVHSRDQLGELADSFNGMTARLGELLAEMAEKKRLEEELRIAREIQMSLLPQETPLVLEGVSLTALCHPAREVGGDYYDFLPLGPNRLGLLIADVSGKGTSAALYMAELKGLMLSLTQIHRSPRDLLVAANAIISQHLDSRSFITMIYAVLDADEGTMTWVRAGHTPVIHLPGDDLRGDPRILVPDGLVLGLKLDGGERFTALLEEVKTPLRSGDLFVFFTDGLSEQMNPQEDLFGEARLASLLADHRDLPFDQLRERIVREVRAFAGGAPQHDDMTFILLRVEHAATGAADRPSAAAYA